MRFFQVRYLSTLVASASLLLLAGMFYSAFGADERTKPPKNIQGIQGKLELYGKIAAIDDKGITLSVTQVDKEYPGNQLTAGQTYFAAIKKGDPEERLLKTNVQLLWQTDGFSGDKQKKLYADNKKNYKKGQFLRVHVKWSEEDHAPIILGATWFGDSGKKGAKKGRS
jgi:hypothetical protein